jgi:hypothetical protein
MIVCAIMYLLVLGGLLRARCGAGAMRANSTRRRGQASRDVGRASGPALIIWTAWSPSDSPG